MPAPVSISIIMEWENVQFSEDSRVGKVLTELARQAAQLVAASTPRAGGLAVARPLELLVLFDSEVADPDEVQSQVRRGLGNCSALQVRFEATPGLAYFPMKNRGAELAAGDLIVYLDSDVIPQPGWLKTLISSFADRSVKVVMSRAFVNPVSFYSRAVALTWFFDRLPTTCGLSPAEHFHANGVAFRRSVLLSHPYPDSPGQARGAGWHLQELLKAEGITVYEHTGALLDHPPPLGLGNYIRRAMLNGSDDYLSIRRRKGTRRSGFVRSLERAIKKWLKAVSNVVRERSVVGLPWWQAPAAAGLAGLYYACYVLGDIRARFQPNLEVTFEEGATTLRIFRDDAAETASAPAVPTEARRRAA
jgi:hypothetical protein